MIEWQIIELPFFSTAKCGNGVKVKLPSGECCIVPFLNIEFDCDNNDEDIDLLLAEKQKEFDALIEEYQEGTYEQAIEYVGEPKSAIVFIDIPLEIRRSVPFNNRSAYAHIGIACFQEEVDLKQFKIACNC
jgi:hypothetical protein